MGSSWCPQCGSDLLAPSAFDSSWRCGRHGKTLPLKSYQHLDASTVDYIRTHAQVPLWFPDPARSGWRLAGLASVGDARSGLRATVAAFSGPAPLGGDGQWLFVAEEPGIGLGASYSGLAPGSADADGVTDGIPSVRVAVRGHPLPVWPVRTPPDRSAYRGEASGVWLWVVGFPADAGYAVLDDLGVSDTSQAGLSAIGVEPLSRLLRPRPLEQ